MFMKLIQFLCLCIVGLLSGSVFTCAPLETKGVEGVREGDVRQSDHDRQADSPIAVQSILNEDYQIYKEGDPTDYEHLFYTLSFGFEGKAYEATFKSQRDGTIQLFEKVGPTKNLLDMPETLAGFAHDGGKYIIQYLCYLARTSKYVTPILNIYPSPQSICSDKMYLTGTSCQIQNQYLSKKALGFAEYFTAFKNGTVDFLIIPLHVNGSFIREPLEEAEAYEEVRGHINCAILFKDLQKNIQLTLVDTTAQFNGFFQEGYSFAMEQLYANTFLVIDSINALLSNKNCLSGIRDGNPYQLDDTGWHRKEGMDDFPIYKIGINITKQFGKRGCTATTLRVINQLLLKQKVPASLRMVSDSDFQEVDAYKVTYYYNKCNGPLDVFLDKSSYEQLIKDQQTIEARDDVKIELNDLVSGYKCSPEAMTRGDAVKEAMERIMLYLKHPNYSLG